MNAKSAGSLRSEPKRAETRFDKFALQQIGRDFRLKPNQRLVLFMMANVVHYLTGDWTGTLLELHDDTGISRDTLATVVASLVDLGLLLQLEPFTRNGQGCYRLLCLERLIVLREDVAQNLRDRFATDLSAIRGGYVGSSTYDQPKEGSVRNKAIRNEVVSTPKREEGGAVSDEKNEQLNERVFNQLFDDQNPERGSGSHDIAVAENREDDGAYSFGTEESPPEPCVFCGKNTWRRDCDGTPRHSVCEEVPR